MRPLNSCFRAKRTKWVVFALCGIYMLTVAILYWPGRFSYTPDSIELAPGPEAHILSPSALMSRPLNNSHLSVPRLIHQSWKSRSLPAKFDVWSRTCRKKHPDWEWILWTDEDNLKLIKTYLPWLLPVYMQLPSAIYRADLVRNAYMYLFGGVYADLDMECLRPSGSIFEEYNVSTVSHNTEYDDSQTLSNNTKLKAFFGQMGSDKSFSGSIPNAWMASPPGHPFFLSMLYWTHAKLAKANAKLKPEALTGPEALYNGIREYEKDILHTSLLDPQYQKKQLFAGSNPSSGHEVVLLPPWYIFPYNWAHMEFVDICSAQRWLFNPRTCKDRIEVDKLRSYTITYWSHTWTPWGSHPLTTWAVSI